MFHTRSAATPPVGARHPMVLLLALGALLAGSWQCVSRTHKRRVESRPQTLPERLQTWEGEGGRPPPDAQPGAATGGTKVQGPPAGYGPAK